MSPTRLRLLWPFVTLLASGALLAGAHAFERIGGYAPCPLCLMQRDWHWGVVAASIVALILQRTPIYRPRLALFVIGLVFVGSFLRAGFHVGVEQDIFTYVCAAPSGELDLNFDVTAPLEIPSCDDPAWTLFGISMAGYNALISLLLALATFAVALWPERKA
jgi:disulfide bond formation protein DsbB